MEFNKIMVEPLTVNIGAEIHGVDLAKLDDATFDEIHQAFLRYQVIFFRGSRNSAVNRISLSAGCLGNSTSIRPLPLPGAIPRY